MKELAEVVRRELLAGESPRAAAAIEAGMEDGLVIALVALLEGEMGDHHEGMRATMSLLERSMERAPTVACRLMAALYPLASEAYYHEVCDAIDTWIHTKQPHDLVGAFRHKATTATIGYMARKYLEWSKIIEGC
ncbi:MAG: hypothetical protein JXP73_03420 [Deltaproteobacteria bacterium]|jgi:hypothetical protein|nr:hypothetical protein [Deltaproteobacteria bacterium]